MVFNHRSLTTVPNDWLVVQYSPSQRLGDSRSQFQPCGFSASSDASYSPASSSAATASFLFPLMVSSHSSAAPGCSLSRWVAHSSWRSRLDQGTSTCWLPWYTRLLCTYSHPNLNPPRSSSPMDRLIRRYSEKAVNSGLISVLVSSTYVLSKPVFTVRFSVSPGSADVLSANTSRGCCGLAAVVGWTA